jgi:hypothetical protein
VRFVLFPNSIGDHRTSFRAATSRTWAVGREVAGLFAYRAHGLAHFEAAAGERIHNDFSYQLRRDFCDHAE